MVPKSAWSRWLWPEPALELSLESWRGALTGYTLRVLLVTAGILLALVFGSYWPASPPLALWIVGAAYPFAVLALVLVRGSTRAQATIMLAAFQIVTPGLFIRFGPLPSPYLCLLASCVLAAVLIGPRASLAFVGTSLGFVLIGARLHLANGLEGTGDETIAMWFRISLVWITVTGWLVYVTNWLTARIDRALRRKGVALAEAEQAGRLHLKSESRREATESALIEAQRHEAMGRIVSGVSHDFNNSLFVILGWNDLLSRGDVTEAQRVQGHDAIARAGRQASELARRLVSMGRGFGGPPNAIALRPVVEDSVRYLARLLPDSIRVSSELKDVPSVAVDAGLMQQVLLNLALEARDAMPDGGQLLVDLRVRSHGDDPRQGPGASSSADASPDESPDASPDASWVAISMRDSGHGLDESARSKLHRTAGSGHTDSKGVGLAATRAIIDRAGGQLEIESELGRGTVCRVLLPVVKNSKPASAGEPAGVSARPARRATILVVEDDEAVRELMALTLRGHGHVVREAADGDSAMTMIADGSAQDDLLCIDGVLPGAPATAIIERFRVTRPGQPILVCSGNLGTPQLQALVQDERLPFLPKPFTPDELTHKIQELLVRRELLQSDL